MKSQFDETDSLCRESLFKYHVACGEYKIGASILGETQLDSTLCKYNSEKKADILVRCSEAFLQEDDSTSAETLLMRARQYMADVMESSSTDVPSADSEASSITILKLRYRVIKAKCDDSNRKFVDAARQYHELSNTSNSTIPLDEKLELLGNAVTCAVLGKAGPQRSRVLGILYKDDRLKDLQSLPMYTSHASILTKMYTEKLLLTSELSLFEKCLKDHQKALMADGHSIVEKAVIEHNMQTTGKIYKNIKFTELAKILRLQNASDAEEVAAKMITEKRLNASIDQTEDILIFENGNIGSGSTGNDTPGEALTSWDERIRDLCNDVTETVDTIFKKYPALIVDK
jgi:COP9 signalosome complex subunit 4